MHFKNWLMKFTDSNHHNLIIEALSRHRPVLIDQAGIRKASVALILRTFRGESEILFIQRAVSEKDPWSGQIAFPGGGKEELDAGLEQTAIRETLEEVGVSLDLQMIIGRLDDLQGSNRNRALNLAISCFVFQLEGNVPITPNYEVADVFWVPLRTLNDPANHFHYQTAHRPEPFPATRLGQGHNGQQRVLWGLTYRFIQRFFEVVCAED